MMNYILYGLLCSFLHLWFICYLLFVAGYFKDRTDVQCLHRWQKVLNPDLVKGPWSKEVIHL